MSEENKNVITIFDKEYDFNKLDEESQNFVLHLQSIQMQMKELSFKFEELQTTEESFLAKLKSSIEDKVE